jgi:hypothetical protein
MFSGDAFGRKIAFYHWNVRLAHKSEQAAPNRAGERRCIPALDSSKTVTSTAEFTSMEIALCDLES